jgi:hypothetical protein
MSVPSTANATAGPSKLPPSLPATPSKKPTLPSSSTFSFKAPGYPAPRSSSSISHPNSPLSKTRRVSLVSPCSPRVVPAWNFRDDTGLESHIAETSTSLPERKGSKMRKIASEEDEDGGVGYPGGIPDKKVRKRWTTEETQMLVDGCNRVCLWHIF